MAGGGDTAAAVGDNPVQTPLRLVQDVIRISIVGFFGSFKKDCTDLARKVSLLTHLIEEIREFKGDFGASSSSFNSCLFDLSLSLQAAKRLLFAANNFDPNNSSVSNCSSLFNFHFVISMCTMRNLQLGLFFFFATF